MKKVKTIVAVAAFSAILSSPAFSLTQEEVDEIIDANIAIYESILENDDLSQGERRQAEVGIKQLEKLRVRLTRSIERGRGQDPERAIQNSPWIISPA